MVFTLREMPSKILNMVFTLLDTPARIWYIYTSPMKQSIRPKLPDFILNGRTIFELSLFQSGLFHPTTIYTPLSIVYIHIRYF